ncbi:unnamed protein product [Prorocentrum cordatum]|uniref:Right handed beta helix domain-containing protein n=1 Tax=Prorocentrum cordatum TaxID=2364126 RepID=A0ABN9U2S2_9DINO|nr:unnamed protein product [Polarella glacialis]
MASQRINLLHLLLAGASSIAAKAARPHYDQVSEMATDLLTAAEAASHVAQPCGHFEVDESDITERLQICFNASRSDNESIISLPARGRFFLTGVLQIHGGPKRLAGGAGTTIVCDGSGGDGTGVELKDNSSLVIQGVHFENCTHNSLGRKTAISVGASASLRLEDGASLRDCRGDMCIQAIGTGALIVLSRGAVIQKSTHAIQSFKHSTSVRVELGSVIADGKVGVVLYGSNQSVVIASGAAFENLSTAAIYLGGDLHGTHFDLSDSNISRCGNGFWSSSPLRSAHLKNVTLEDIWDSGLLLGGGSTAVDVANLTQITFKNIGGTALRFTGELLMTAAVTAENASIGIDVQAGSWKDDGSRVIGSREGIVLRGATVVDASGVEVAKNIEGVKCVAGHGEGDSVNENVSGIIGGFVYPISMITTISDATDPPILSCDATSS